MFKEKSSKKRIVSSESSKDHATLDARHQQVIASLQEKQARSETLFDEKEALQKEIQKWQKSIEDMKAKDQYDTPEYDAAWTSNLVLLEKLDDIQHSLNEIRSLRDEIDYYENTGYILFQYYDLLKKQGDGNVPASTAPPQRAPIKGRKKHAPVASKSILDCFGCTSNGQLEAIPCGDSPKPIDKSTLVDEYMSHMDTNFLRPLSSSSNALGTCIHCQHELVCLQQEGTMVCPSCGYQELLLVEQNRPLIRQISKEASHQSYKRINHFREWCSQLQGRESTDIPEEVFEQILQEIKKEKISDPKKITYSKMREILKKLKINKYYEHSVFIIRRICDVQAPHFSPELEEKLCAMFKEIQGSFVKHCPPSRRNFLSYSYVLFKFFQILGQQDKQYLDYCKHLVLLKSRAKLYVQDQIFKAICEDLGWPVIPTL